MFEKGVSFGRLGLLSLTNFEPEPREILPLPPSQEDGQSR